MPQATGPVVEGVVIPETFHWQSGRVCPRDESEMLGAVLGGALLCVGVGILSEPAIDASRLAYPIGPRENGYYVVARFDADSAGIPEYERALKLDESVIRYLLTIFENEVGAPPMTEEELALAKKRGEDDDDDEE